MKLKRIAAIILSLVLLVGVLPVFTSAAMAEPSRNGCTDRRSPDGKHAWVDRHRSPACEITEGIVYTCRYCGKEVFEETGPALGHKWGPWHETREGTCVQKQVVKRECSVCRKQEEWVKDYGDHDWGEWETVTEATETEEGLRRRVCKLSASHVEEEVIPPGNGDALSPAVKSGSPGAEPPVPESSEEALPVTKQESTAKLTGTMHSTGTAVGDYAYASYKIENTGEVPLYLSERYGDALHGVIPEVLEPHESHSWIVPHMTTMEDYEKGFHIDPNTGEEVAESFDTSLITYYAGISFTTCDAECTLWSIIYERVEGPELTLTVLPAKDTKEVYEVGDEPSYHIYLLNTGTVELTDLKGTFSDDLGTFIDPFSYESLMPGIGVSFTRTAEITKTHAGNSPFHFVWKATGCPMDPDTYQKLEPIQSNQVQLDVQVMQPGAEKPEIYLENADGSGDGAWLGDWVNTKLTFTNTGNVHLFIGSVGVVAEEDVPLSCYDISEMYGLNKDGYDPGEGDSFNLKIQVCQHDVEAGAVKRWFTMISNSPIAGVCSNEVEVNIPLSGTASPAPDDGTKHEAKLSLEMESLTGDPLWLNADDKTEPVQYKATVKNTGDVPVTLKKMQFTTADGTFTIGMDFQSRTLLVGEPFSFKFLMSYTAADVVGEEIKSTFRLYGESDIGPAESNPAEVTHKMGEQPAWKPDPVTDIQVQKQETGHSKGFAGYTLGETVQYVVRVKNISETTIKEVKVHDVFLNKDRTFNDIEPDTEQFCFFYLPIDQPLVDMHTITNSVIATWVDPVTGETLTRYSDDCVVHTAEETPETFYGIYIEKTAVSTPENKAYFQPGEPIKYKILVKNATGKVLYDLKVDDPMGGSHTFESLDPDKLNGYKFVHTVSGAEADLLSLTNTVTVTAHDANGKEYACSASETVPTGRDPDPDTPSLYLFLNETSKPSDPRGYQVGEWIRFDLKVTNNGTTDLHNVMVIDWEATDWRYQGTIPVLHPDESQTFKLEWQTTEEVVYNENPVYRVFYGCGAAKSDEIKDYVFSNDTESPTWHPDPVPEGELGETVTCVPTLDAAGDAVLQYTLTLCPDHAEAAAQTAALLDAAETLQDQVEAWQAVGQLWLDEIHEMYDRLNEHPSQLVRMKASSDREAMDAYVATMDADLALQYLGDPVRAAQAKAEWLMRQCAELCYLNGSAPAARSDSRVYHAPQAASVFGESECGVSMTLDGSATSVIREQLCGTHAEREASIRIMLGEAVTRPEYTDVLSRGQRIWRSLQDQATSAFYGSAAAEDRPAVVAHRQAFDLLVSRRTALLNALYPDNPETVAEVLCTMLRQYVLMHCVEE